jgi:hypothetical protein
MIFSRSKSRRLAIAGFIGAMVPQPLVQYRRPVLS